MSNLYFPFRPHLDLEGTTTDSHEIATGSEGSNLQKFKSSGSSQGHHYGVVGISGNGNAVLGDVYNYNVYTLPNPSEGVLDLKAIADSLAYPDMNNRFQTLSDPYPDTFTWILNAKNSEENYGATSLSWDSFPIWLESGITPYWISGKLGSGKSTLMKYLMENLSDSRLVWDERKEALVISHFFWAPGSDLHNSVQGCLRSLLWQILDFNTNDATLKMLRNPKTLLRQRDLVNVRLLREFLLKILTGAHNSTIIILLDGLDECPQTDELLDLVDALTETKNVKLCISSRREEVYVQNFSHFAKLRLQDLNRKDIEDYVETELLKNPRLQRAPGWSSKDAQQLAYTITYQAEGVFLWVRLVVKDLIRGWTNRDDLTRMQRRVEKLPQDIYKLYTELIDRDQENLTEYESEAAIYYQMLLHSPNRRVPLASLYFATNKQLRARYMDLETVFNTPVSELEHSINLDAMTTWINVRSAGLLEVEEGGDIFCLNSSHRPGPTGKFMDLQWHWVGFIHRSAFSYLKDTPEGQRLMNKTFERTENLLDIYVQSQLATSIVIPGTYNFTFNPGWDLRIEFSRLFSVRWRQDLNLEEWCQFLQKLFNALFDRGLVSTSKNWRTGHFPAFPRSKFQKVDLCLLFAATFTFEKFADHFLQLYHGVETDDQYMIRVLLLMLHGCVIHYALSGRNGRGDPTMWLQRLASHAGQSFATRDEQAVSTTIELGIMALRFYPQFESDEIWKFLEQMQADLNIQVGPTCSGLLPINFSRCLGGDHPFVVIASLSLRTLRAWYERKDENTYSATGSALLIVDCRASPVKYGVIDEADSDQVLESIRSMLISLSPGTQMLPQSGGGLCTSMESGFQLECSTDTIFQSLGLTQVFGRCHTCHSFVEYQQFLGVRGSSIVQAIKGFVKDTAFFGSLTPQEARSEFFGDDSHLAAEWFRKFPELATLLDPEREVLG